MINRIPPKMGTRAYMTFASRSPLATHSRKATCAEVGCRHYQEGWTIPLKGIDPQLEYVARHAGRQFREVDGVDFGIGEGRYLVFPPGQPCFRSESHRVSLERAAFYFVGRGDHRSFDIRQAAQRSEENWIDQFANHQAKLREVQERG